MPEPNIQKDTNVDYRRAANAQQPPARIIENEPKTTLAAALASGKRQVDATK